MTMREFFSIGWCATHLTEDDVHRDLTWKPDTLIRTSGMRERDMFESLYEFCCCRPGGPEGSPEHEGREILRAETSFPQGTMEKMGGLQYGYSTLEALRSPFYRVPRISSKLDHL
jgi:hypothetical protein